MLKALQALIFFNSFLIKTRNNNKNNIKWLKNESFWSLSKNHISHEQYKKYMSRNGKVEFVVSDTSLFNGIYYNAYNVNNVSDLNKTMLCIMKWFHDFN